MMSLYSIPDLDDQDAAITITLAATTGMYVFCIVLCKMCVGIIIICNNIAPLHNTVKPVNVDT